MTMQDFIKENRTALDRAIDRALGSVPATASCYCPLSGTEHFHQPDKRNDAERRQWILNDEGLYRWAQNEGVNI